MVGPLLGALACAAGGAAPHAPHAPQAVIGALAGACEASSILPWEGGWLVGDNETPGHLYQYNADFTERVPLPLAAPVDDIEALAAADGSVWVVGSHSTNKRGERRTSRERLLRPDGTAAAIDFTACSACLDARNLAPNAGGLNIEGAAWLHGQLWIGLRSPLVRGQAQLLALDASGRVERILLADLGGLGVRELVADGAGWLLVAGPVADGDTPHSLYQMDTPDSPPIRLPIDLPSSTEGIARDAAQPGQLVYVTDGDGKNGDCAPPATWGRVALPPRAVQATPAP